MSQFTKYPFNPAVTFGKLLVLLLLCSLATACTQVAPTLPLTNTVAPTQTASLIPVTETLTVTPLPTAAPTGTPTTPARTATQRVTPTRTQSPSPTPWPATITDAKGVPMALIPAGSFEMGGDPEVALAECQKYYTSCDMSYYQDEAPIHTVMLDTFYMDVYEVTNARYAECVQAGKCRAPSESRSSTRSSYYGNAQYADYPVIYVSWEDANTYCTWRDARLPTEAEWEKAARGGLEGKVYPWGDEIDCEKANYCEDDNVVVGSYPPNGYGLYDMAGNVWEWVADWYGAYSSSPAENPQEPTSGEARVLRGGSRYNNPYGLRVSDRGWYAPSIRGDFIGFRCSRSP